jgi:hypothetical protein
MPDQILKFIRSHIWPKECRNHAYQNGNGTERMVRAAEAMTKEAQTLRIAIERLEAEPDPLGALVANMRYAKQDARENGNG